jgi:hypothetical protein
VRSGRTSQARMASELAADARRRPRGTARGRHPGARVL